MKKILTITFHSSYNFGSSLQAYALQEYIKKISESHDEEIIYKIINLRTKIQRNMYNYRINSTGLKRYLKKIVYGKKLQKKEELFEKFIKEYLQLTDKEYKDVKELQDEEINADYYISGSDQIWNINALDFNWSYFLDFVKKGKKISYATSLGPKKNTIRIEEEEKLKKYLNEYDEISVREEESYKKVQKYLNVEKCNINVDPTILLTKKEWEKLLEKQNKINKDYILFYTLKMSKSRMKFLKAISKKLKMPIVVLNPACTYDIMGGFIKRYDSGPIEFLNYIKHAKLIVSSSFHGTVFSIIFNKPFYAIDGISDFRISTLLKKTGLENRSISLTDNLEEKLRDIYNIDFNLANKVIEEERDKSRKYLMKALEMGD